MDQETRDKLIEEHAQVENKYGSHMIRFKGLTLEGLRALEGFFNPDYYRMPFSPRDIMGLMEKFNTDEVAVTALGYATGVDREDYNIFLDGVEVFGPYPPQLLSIMADLKPAPDEYGNDTVWMRVWYD